MNKIRMAALAFVAVIGLAAASPVLVSAESATATQINKGVTAVGGSDAVPLGTRIQQVVNILLYVLGAIAVLMIVIGGVRYTTSNGDSSAVKGAKDTILYAIVGLVVAVMAYAIVNFVVKSF
jgi:hypothetical protein